MGFVPNRRTHDAIAEIHHLTSGTRNYHWVLEADIAACFDEIGHTPRLDRIRRRSKDKRVCNLVKAFLKAGVITTTGDRERYSEPLTVHCDRIAACHYGCRRPSCGRSPGLCGPKRSPTAGRRGASV